MTKCIPLTMILVVLLRIRYSYSQISEKFEKCLTTTVEADTDQSQTLNRTEFTVFRRALCEESQGNVTDMTLMETSLFKALACICRAQVNADPLCCDGDDANIVVDGVVDAVAGLTLPQDAIDLLESVCTVAGTSCPMKQESSVPSTSPFLSSDVPTAALERDVSRTPFVYDTPTSIDMSSDMPSNPSSDIPSDIGTQITSEFVSTRSARPTSAPFDRTITPTPFDTTSMPSNLPKRGPISSPVNRDSSQVVGQSEAVPSLYRSSQIFLTLVLSSLIYGVFTL